MFAAVIALSGCASPGPPLQPTLNLPQPAKGLSAMRVGDEVRLHWMTPTQTTDKLPVKGAVTAKICREILAAGKVTCPEVALLSVTAGASYAVDTLPAMLTSGPARIVSYRVQLLNAAKRSAGPSPAVFAVAGVTPRPIKDFSGDTIKAGVLLRWRSEPHGPGSSVQGVTGRSTVELDRTTVESADGGGPTGDADLAHKSEVQGAQKQAVETRLEASADAGGALDRTAEIGHAYSYTAQRVDVVHLAGLALEMRSVPTNALAFVLRDDLPPDVPAGLVAVPGLAGEGVSQKSAIDLSWEPDLETRIAGYRVYRRELGTDASMEWVRVGTQALTVAAYRDLAVVAGHRYAYRVAAVSTTGNESGPSGEAVETAPRP